MMFFKKDKGLSATELWEQFFRAAVKNEWDKAFDLIHKLKAIEPDNAQVHLKCGDLLQKKGDRKGAVAEYHLAAATLDNSVDSMKALAVYKIILRIEPSDEKAMARTRGLISGMDETSSAPPAVAHPAQATAQEAQKASPAAPTQTMNEAFAKHPLFSVLSSDDIKEIPKRATLHTYTDGQPVISEDDSGDAMFIIKRGRAKVISTMLGRTFTLATLGNLDFFGEGGFLTGRARSATVSAEGPLEVFEITKELLNDLIERNPMLLSRLVDISQSRTRNMLDKLKDIG